ncbi:hypothetical protein Pint_21658 [Pistacia integerrima]|uniref:Uncharacterized protein n=1 Tax=Pistacia integerrima TaxID=434235 RepID=A0ACC0XBC5_9ROSI|nr:hypothetical protein Pint_21658 [Pistacia integerrima]
MRTPRSFSWLKQG